MTDSLHPTTHAEANPFSRPHTPHHGGGHQIGFAGLGGMGYPMARNMANKAHLAHPVKVWNRSTSKAEKMLGELGPKKITIAKSLDELAKECDIIFTNLANDAVVKDVYTKFAEAIKASQIDKPRIFVETSTIYPTLAGELDTLISSVNARLVTAPVFGPPVAAEGAQLIVAMAGDYRSKKEIANILVPAVGKKVIDLGGNLEKAPTFKLIGNSLILGSLEILAESFTMAEKAGIDAETTYGLVKDLMPTPMFINYGLKMKDDLFDGSNGFAVDGGIKDATHIRRLATELNAPMPALDVAHRNLLTARALHIDQKAKGKQVFDTLDWSSLIAGTRVAAGLDGLDSAKHSKVVPEKED